MKKKEKLILKRVTVRNCGCGTSLLASESVERGRMQNEDQIVFYSKMKEYYAKWFEHH